MHVASNSVSINPSESAKGVDTGRQFWRRMFRNRKAALGAIVLLVIIVSAIFAPFVTPYDPVQQNLRNRLQPPSADHWLGTDHFGRDVFTRIIYGARISVRVGFISVSIALLLGGTIGLLAAYYGRWVDTLLMRLVDVMLALPAILMALAVVAALGPGLNNVMIAVGIAYTPVFARVMRSAVLQVRELDFVSAALALGGSNRRVMLKHILPNSLNPIIVQVTLATAGSVLAAAGLSFLGLGSQPPTPEWGSMLSSARPYIRVAHHAVTYPGLAIMITVLALNMVGDGLRDALDPRMEK